MAKRVKGKRTRQRQRSYDNYVKRYKAKEKKLKEKGFEMASKKLSKRDYERAKRLLKDSGVDTNINQTIVSEQAYEYNRATARRFRKIAKEKDLEWEEKSELEIMKGEVDVSAYNNWLKENHPDMTGYDRRNRISHDIFGSK